MADQSPLLPKSLGQGPITDSTYLRRVIQKCFDQAIDKLKQDGYEDEANLLNETTVHCLCHTGISDDVKHRPRVSMFVIMQDTAQELLQIDTSMWN